MIKTTDKISMPLLTFQMQCKDLLSNISLNQPVYHLKYNNIVLIVPVSELVAMFEVVCKIFGHYDTSHTMILECLSVAEKRYLITGGFEIKCND